MKNKKLYLPPPNNFWHNMDSSQIFFWKTYDVIFEVFKVSEIFRYQNKIQFSNKILLKFNSWSKVVATGWSPNASTILWINHDMTTLKIHFEPVTKKFIENLKGQPKKLCFFQLLSYFDEIKFLISCSF